MATGKATLILSRLSGGIIGPTRSLLTCRERIEAREGDLFVLSGTSDRRRAGLPTLRRPGVRVLLVDNHPVMRLGIKTLLDEAEDVEAVSEAESGDAALRAARRQHPDVVVLDPELGESASGLKTCRDLKSMVRPPKVLIYTAQNSRENVAAAVLAGADAYVYKGAERDRLPETISRTGDGERTWILGSEETSGGRLKERIDGSNLTPKESEILNLLISRYGNREIADTLYLSRNTVKTHVRNILKKLGLESRRDLFEDDSP